MGFWMVKMGLGDAVFLLALSPLSLTAIPFGALSPSAVEHPDLSYSRVACSMGLTWALPRLLNQCAC